MNFFKGGKARPTALLFRFQLAAFVHLQQAEEVGYLTAYMLARVGVVDHHTVALRFDDF